MTPIPQLLIPFFNETVPYQVIFYVSFFQLPLSALKLDYHGRDKIKRLLGEKFNPKTKVISISSQRCPTRQQNFDYIQYLLAAVYTEATVSRIFR